MHVYSISNMYISEIWDKTILSELIKDGKNLQICGGSSSRLNLITFDL